MPRPVHGVKEARRNRAAGLALGYSYEDQGYYDRPGEGGSAYRLADFKSKYGARADPTWQAKVVNGVVYYKARKETPGRVEATGGDWFVAPDRVQRGYNNPNYQAYFGGGAHAANADEWQKFKMLKGGRQQFMTQGWQVDPATGYMVNPQAPDDIRTVDGRRVDPVTGQPLGGGLDYGDAMASGGSSMRFDPTTQTYAPSYKSAPAPVAEATMGAGLGAPSSSKFTYGEGSGLDGIAYHPPGSIQIQRPDGTTYTPPPSNYGEGPINSDLLKRRKTQALTLGTLAGLGA